MERVDYHRRLREIIAVDQGVDEVEIFTPSLSQLRMGQIDRGFLDIGDLLPQISSDELDQVLTKMASTGQRAIGVISIYYSDVVQTDGKNLYKTVRPPEWWNDLLRRHFSKADFMRSQRESEFVWTNFKVSKTARKKIDRLAVTPSFRRELERFVSRAKLAGRVLKGNCVRREELLSALEGKAVAVVGNARSLDRGSHGRDIDAHDIVIRFNRVPIVSTISHGQRTTWVATGVPISPQRMASLGATHVLWLSRYRRKIPSETAGIDRLYLHPSREIDVLAKRSGVARPTTGLTAIDFLCSSEARKITLFGFDFYQSQSSSSHQTIETAPHQFDKEEVFVRSLAEKDARFEFRQAATS